MSTPIAGEPVRPRVDPAVAQARRVIGLYGDPDVSWSIVLALDLAIPARSQEVSRAAVRLVADNPHLGVAPVVESFGPAEEGSVLARLADTPYGDHDPLVRVALASGGRTLLVAGHHGALDGLGLLGAAGILAGLDLTSSARGIATTDEPGGFGARSLRRLAEALFAPPIRLATDPDGGAVRGDVLTERVIDAARPGSAALVAAVAVAVRRWNAAASTPAPGRRLVLAMGLSRRPGSPAPAPDRDTAFVRLHVDGVHNTADARALIAETAPEPAFPVSDGRGLGPRFVRLLSGRLGATVLVSNLGRVDHPGLERIRFWPEPTGPAGTAIGLVTTSGTTTLSVRARREWFTPRDAAAWTDLVAAALVETAAQ